MKKSFILFKAVSLLIIYTPLSFGLYMGSPSSAEVPQKGLFFSEKSLFGVKLGYQGDYLFDKSLKVTNSNVRSVDLFKYGLQQGVLSACFADRFDLYGSLGGMKFTVDAKTSPTEKQEYRTAHKLSWGVGGRGIIYQTLKVNLAADVKYQESYPTIQNIYVNSVPVSSTGGAKLKYQEYQISLGLSYMMTYVMPYLGVRYSHMLMRIKNLNAGLLPSGKNHFKVQSKKKFGLAVGATITSGAIFSLDVEARAIDESALTIAANLKF